MSKLIGHQTQRTALAQLASEERLPSSLLLTGVAGIGKILVARELAKQLLCASKPCGPQGGCNTCRSCSLFDAGNHPDIHTLTFGEDGASVDDLRDTLENLSLKSFMGGRKVAIFDSVDAISTVGANSILKSLEEPRPETFYLLIASNPSRLPQTVLSRCQRWFFDRLTPGDIQAILKERGITSVRDSAVTLADGSLNGVDSLQERAEMWDDIHHTLDAAFRGDVRKVSKAAQEWGSDKEGLKDRLTFLRSSIRQKLLSSTRDYSAAAVWAHGLQNAIDAEYVALDRHVNPTLVILQVLQSCNAALAFTYQNTPNTASTLLDTLQS